MKCDNQYWTVVGTGADYIPNIVFGSTANAPAGGDNGSLQILDPEGFEDGDQAEMVMYTAIELEASKTYQISGLIKHDKKVTAYYLVYIVST